MEEADKVGEKSDESSEKKEPPPGLQKICLVCGDRALGYNFNAISCESCKAFFRRNALAGKQLKCPFSGNCAITVVTRRFCQKCRLEKCLAVGMVKEFIMSEEDKAEKRRKIEENRARKRRLCEPGETGGKSARPEPPACSPSSTTPSVDSECSQPPPALDPSYTMKVYPIDEKSVINRAVYDQRLMDSYNVYDNMDSNMDTNMYLEHIEQPKQNSIRSILSDSERREVYMEKAHVCHQLPSTSSHPDTNKALDILQDVERIEPNSMESILCEAIKLEFEAYTSVNPCSGSSRELNEVERAKLNELIVANKALNAPVDDDMSLLLGDAQSASFKEGGSEHDPRLLKIVNLTAVAIRRFINMAKKISAFRNMCEEDQIALLKGGCIEMMVLRSTMNYDGQQNQWKIPYQKDYASIRTELLKLAKGSLYRSHEAFIRSFPAAWRADESLILVLSAVLLFTPERPRVVHADVVKLEQNSYYYLLRRYLESVYPGCEAKSTFLKIIQKILELRKLAAEVTDVYLDVNPLEPLLVEIFDLKHHVA